MKPQKSNNINILIAFLIFLHFCLLQPNRQTNGQNIYIYSFMRGICTKKLELYLNQVPRKLRFPLNVVDIRTDGRTFAFIDQLCQVLKTLVVIQCLYQCKARKSSILAMGPDVFKCQQMLLVRLVWELIPILE